jgi:hypothetical protein
VPGEEAPQAARAGSDIRLGQSVAQLPQDDVRMRFAQRQDPISVRLDGGRAVIPARQLGGDPPLLPDGIGPADRAGRADAEPLGRLTTRRAHLDGCDNTLA